MATWFHLFHQQIKTLFLYKAQWFLYSSSLKPEILCVDLDFIHIKKPRRLLYLIKVLYNSRLQNQLKPNKKRSLSGIKQTFEEETPFPWFPSSCFVVSPMIIMPC
jgi:hypothetical protein